MASMLIGGLVPGVVCLAGTRRFGENPRLLFASVAGYLGAAWACKWNMRSGLDPIITADGSRMQKELINIMIAKQEAGHLRPSFISNHLYKLLYPERVFMDSSPDNIYTRWRLRNTYEDNFDGATLQKLSVESSKRATRSVMQISTESPKPTTPATTQRLEVKGLDSLIRDNPLESIFGSPISDQEVGESHNNVARSRKHSHKRTRRRHKARDHRAQYQTPTADVNN